MEQFRQAIEENPHLYLDLDVAVQCIEDVAHQALVSPKSNVAIQARALQHFPHFSSQSRDVLISIAERGNLELLEQSLTSNPTWCDDEKVMKAIIHREASFIRLASRRLRMCPIFIRDSIMTAKSARNVLRCVDPEVLEQHPNIILDALTDGRMPGHNEECIPEILWAHKEFCLEWLKRGGKSNVMVLEKFGWREDNEIALTIARHQWYSFRCLGEGIRRNRDFVLEALQVNGMVILCNIDPLLRRDLQVGATAISRIGRTIQIFHFDELRRVLDLKALQQQLECKLGFLEFARGIEEQLPWERNTRHPDSSPERSCCLSLLNCGLETKEGIKQLIGEYLGVPPGPDLYALYKEANDILLYYAALYCI
eukprot:Nitzschia sp. Nitz4//scaffold300_size22576//5406//6509//NITZ4_008543-RA/size22576-processed-gene-0.24-mRNA-1//-1//CDS//3329546982//6707//frame0